MEKSNDEEKEYREIGRKCLSSILKVEKNIDILEKNVYKFTEGEEDYKKVIYQVIGDIINKKKIKDIYNNIINKRFGYSHECFNYISNKIAEQDDFIQNPFNIEKGVMTCKCGSERVFSYSKQTRSGDESTTIFCECVECKRKWTC